MTTTRLLPKISLGLLILLATISGFSEHSVAESRKYSCAQLKGVFRTFVSTAHGDIPIIRWVSRHANISKRDRCIAVTQRFEAFDQNRILKYMRAGKINGIPVICIAHKRGGNCPQGNVLITLDKGKDANQILNDILDLNRASSEGGIPLTDDISFRVNGDLYVNMNNWIQLLEKGASKR